MTSKWLVSINPLHRDEVTSLYEFWTQDLTQQFSDGRDELISEHCSSVDSNNFTVNHEFQTQEKDSLRSFFPYSVQ